MTALDIYNKSLVLLGEVNGDGETQPDTAVFKRSAVELINILLMITDETDRKIKGDKPGAFDHMPQQISSLNDTLYIHPRLASAAIPLGLCFFLVHEENEEKGARFYKLFYDELNALEKAYKKGKIRTTKKLY